MSSSSEWPPQWKDVTESPQHKYFMIQQFLRPFDEEKFEHLDNEHYNCPDYDGKSDGTVHQVFLKFLRQVRESRGYDVDVVPHPPIDSPYIPLPLGEAKMREEWYFEPAMNITCFAVEQINAQAKEHGAGTRYELKDLEKIVDTSQYFIVLLTFTVKEFVCGSDTNSDHVVKTVQAMVKAMTVVKCGTEINELLEWRFKPDELLDQVFDKSQVSDASESL